MQPTVAREDSEPGEEPTAETRDPVPLVPAFVAKGIIQYRGPMHHQENELSFGNDIMVMANPAMANLPMWVIALLMAGCIAAALSTAAGLLLVLSTSISHDLIKRMVKPDISDKGELIAARISAFFAVLLAGYFGINPPDFVAATVALAFGLAAASFFPAIVLGIFYKKMNKEGAISGMLIGILSMLFYMTKFKFGWFGGGGPEDWWFGISPEGFGTIAMLINLIVSISVSNFSSPPPEKIINNTNYAEANCNLNKAASRNCLNAKNSYTPKDQSLIHI